MTWTPNGNLYLPAYESYGQTEWNQMWAGFLNVDSKMDSFVTPETFGAVGDGATDDTAAVQDAFDMAQANKKIVLFNKLYAVSDTVYFGDQTSTGATAPAGIYGCGYDTGLIALPGCSGTVLQAQSAAWKQFGGFKIDGNSIADTCFDSSWMGGAGPSVQNRYKRLKLFGATGTIWKAEDNNDCVFDQCAADGADFTNQNQIGLDLSASGGLVWIRDCIWSFGYLKFKCQNGRIENSWGHGILFGSGCLNYVTLDGCYVYANKTLDACLASESFAAQQSLRSLICNTTQFITVDPLAVSAYFDLNLYSIADFNGCFFTGKTTALFGANSRRDSYDSVRVKLRGGSFDSTYLTLNKPSGYVIESEGFMDDATGYAAPSYEMSWNPVISGGTSAGTCTYGGRTGEYRITGNMVEYSIAVTWTGHNGTGQLQITGFPGAQSGQASADIGYTGNTFGDTVVTINLVNNVASVWKWNGDPFEIPATGNIAISGSYKI